MCSQICQRIMFSVENIPGIGFDSSWQVVKKVQESDAQTEDLSTIDNSTSTTELAEVGCQADGLETQVKLDSVDYDAVQKFLTRVEPMLSEELKAAASSTAFEGWNPFSENSDLKNAVLVHLLSWKDKKTKIVNDVSWNSNGRRVGAAMGEASHVSWCEHEGFLVHWGISRSTVDTKQPTSVITAPACLTSLAFHPSEPSLVAVGSFNGELLIYDLNRETEDVLLASSGQQQQKKPSHPTSDDERDEAISCVRWTRNFFSTTAAHALIVTGSLDGRLLVWALNPLSGDLSLQRAFVLNPETLHFPDRHIPAGAPSPGITSLAPVTTDASQFVIGTEGGGLGITGSLQTASGDSDLPISLSLRAHTGHVSSTAWQSREGSALLGSTGIDGEIHVFDLKESLNPLLNVVTGYSVLSASWLRPTVFLVAAGNPIEQQKSEAKRVKDDDKRASVLIFDLRENVSAPTLRLEAEQIKGVVTKLQSSPGNPRYVLCGTSAGELAVWLIPERCVARSKDWEALNALLNEND